MSEYKVVAAPTKAIKRKGLKTSEARFAAAIEETLNTEAQNGWEYVRAETLPREERSGLTGKSVQFQTMLIFKRAVANAAPAGAAAHAVEPTAPKLGSALPQSPESAPPVAAPDPDATEEGTPVKVLETPARDAPEMLDVMRTIKGAGDDGPIMPLKTKREDQDS